MTKLPRILAGIFALGLGTACSGGSHDVVVPRLPGSGTENLPEPVAPEEEPRDGDRWSERDDLFELPPITPPATLDFPSVTRFTLRSGLKVLVVEDPSVPTVGLQLAVRAGRRHVPPEKTGLDSLVAAMLTRGNQKMSAAEIAALAEESGAHVAASAGSDATLVSCAVASRRLDVCLTLLPEIVVRPSFEEEELTEARRRFAEKLAEAGEDAAKLATAHLEYLLFGEEHFRARQPSPTTVGALGRGDLVSWHRTWFRPQNAMLVAVGDVRADELRRRLERALSGWRRGPVPKSAPFAQPDVQGIVVRLVDKPDEETAQVRIGRPGVLAREPYYHSAVVAAEILGEEGRRLTRAVRARFGEAAVASASIDRGFENRGAFMAAARVPAAGAVEAARLLMGELGRLGDPGPSGPEVARVALRVAGGYPRRVQSSIELAGALLAAEMVGLGDEFVRRFPNRVGSVGREQIGEAAELVFGTEDLVVVLCGKASEIEPQLEEAGWVYEKVAYDEPISARERERAERERQKPVSAAAERRARAILDQALAAKGGRKRVAALRTLRWKGDAVVDLPGGKIRGEILKRHVAPDKLRLDMHLVDVKVLVTTVIEGERAWAKETTPDGERILDLPAAEVQAARAQLWRDQDFVLLRHLEEGTRVEALPDVSVQGTPHHAVELRSPDGRYQVVLLIDKESHLLSGMRYTDQGMEAEERLSDFRKVGGLMIAHKRFTKSPQMQLQATLSEVGVDEEIEASLFAKPK